MKQSILTLIFIFGVSMFTGFSGLSWAQQSTPISIEVNFDKDYYDYGEPIGVEVVVRNISGEDLYVTKGFSSKKFYLEMRVIDPAGRLLLPKRNEPRTEFPDAPAAPVILNSSGKAVQVAECEVFPASGPGSVITQQIANLSDYYETKFSGSYYAEVQVTPMIFKRSELEPGNPCYGDIKNYKSLELVKSEPKQIYTQGTTTEVDIIPRYWLFAWKNVFYLIPDIAVAIWPAEGKTVDDYRMDTIRLNNDLAKKVVKMYSFLRQKHYLLAFFDKFKAINSLGQVQADQEYPVLVSGMFKNNTYFGGGQKIKVIRIFD
jgi:hypothetical protein